MARRILGYLFLLCATLATYNCAKRGSPTGGEKDTTPPELIKATPENFSIDFKANKIRLIFDEYIKLNDVRNQLVVSPPLKNTPLITPQGSASKYIEITLKDTLLPNTTYTFNFGQSITDNNEGNPNSFLSYVVSTGSYIDSLAIGGLVKDGINAEPDSFISVMLYAMDSTFNDSTVYKQPPLYITNTLDSLTTFSLKNLKEGTYAMVALKDENKNALFDQAIDKIGFLPAPVTIPTDSFRVLTLFRETPNYSAIIPKLEASNKIVFGYSGGNDPLEISLLTQLPDSVKTRVTKETGKDSLNFWITPFEADSLVFTIANTKQKVLDTFSVKTRKLNKDSLTILPMQQRELAFNTPIRYAANTPIKTFDASKIKLITEDSIPVFFESSLDSVANNIMLQFDIKPKQAYILTLLPATLTDFFGTKNDTLTYNLFSNSYEDYGNLKVNLLGDVRYPLLVELLNTSGETERSIAVSSSEKIVFNHLKPKNYTLRVIYDANENGIWDTGNYILKIQPERVSYYPEPIEIRANWEKEETFTLLK